MAKITSIATAVPPYQHTQQHLQLFMEGAYRAGEREKRILSYLYAHSGIETRYSVIPDFTAPVSEWEFFPQSRDLEPFPDVGKRMEWYSRHALPLSLCAANDCLKGVADKNDLTNLITVSCTGLSAPGLELQLLHAMGLDPAISRTAINFMGCYAALHGLKMANDIVNANPGSKVLVVCTELCSLHFQKTFTDDTIAAPLIFGDGCAAVLVSGDDDERPGIRLDSFYSEVLNTESGKMTWNLSPLGFVMTLEADVPDVIQKNIGLMQERALLKAGYDADDIAYWCMHPGGKRILEAIQGGLNLEDGALSHSYEVMRQYGNMSSASILFVLKDMWHDVIAEDGAHIFAAAFGPGLTMESAILTVA